MNDPQPQTDNQTKADMMRIAKWIGLAYLPIAILVVIIFILVEYHYNKVESGVEVVVETSVLTQ